MGTDLKDNFDLIHPGINEGGEKGSKSPVIKITFRVYSGGWVIQDGNDRGGNLVPKSYGPKKSTRIRTGHVEKLL